MWVQMCECMYIFECLCVWEFLCVCMHMFVRFQPVMCMYPPRSFLRSSYKRHTYIRSSINWLIGSVAGLLSLPQLLCPYLHSLHSTSKSALSLVASCSTLQFSCSVTFCEAHWSCCPRRFWASFPFLLHCRKSPSSSLSLSCFLPQVSRFSPLS